MLNIGVLTFNPVYRWANNDLYPLIKWRKEFKKSKINFNYFTSHESKYLFHHDIVFIDHRYYRNLVVEKQRYPDKYFIIRICDKLRDRGIKVVLLDNDDSVGSNQFDLIEHVDILVKKQIFKDLNKYTINEGKISYMPFIAEYKLSEEKNNQNYNFKKLYTPCPTDQLYKIKLGWNIGMCDYRYFPLKKFTFFNTSQLFNQIYPYPIFNDDLSKKTIDSVFRGTINKKDGNYSFQRNELIELFNQLKEGNFISGSSVNKRRYMRELRKSKICVSPFGWGEICYRDFEAVISGSLLLKPDMDHIQTFPDIYKKYETYIPLMWNMEDLKEKLLDSVNNYGHYTSFIKKSQKIYKKSITDYAGFINHFKKIIHFC